MSRQASRAGDRDDRADGEVDAAGRDHGGHPERDEHRRRAEAQDVDQAAVEVPVLHAQGEEGVAEEEVDEQQHADRRQRPDETARQRAHAAASRAIVWTRRSTVTSSPSFSISSMSARSRSTTDPVAQPQHLLELGRDEQHGHAVVAERAHEPLHLGLGADVDAARRLVEDQQPRLR